MIKLKPLHLLPGILTLALISQCTGQTAPAFVWTSAPDVLAHTGLSANYEVRRDLQQVGFKLFDMEASMWLRTSTLLSDRLALKVWSFQCTYMHLRISICQVVCLDRYFPYFHLFNPEYQSGNPCLPMLPPHSLRATCSDNEPPTTDEEKTAIKEKDRGSPVSRRSPCAGGSGWTCVAVWRTRDAEEDLRGQRNVRRIVDENEES